MTTRRAVPVSLLLSSVVQLFGGISPEVRAGLAASDWRVRAAAYRAVVAQADYADEDYSALIALLSRERINHPALGASSLDQHAENVPDPAWGTYVFALQRTVMAIAEKSPQRADVWPVLVASGFGHSSEMMPWLARHSDATAPYYLRAAQGEIPGLDPGEALLCLAKIIVYERDPATDHHLTPAGVSALERAIRDRLDDKDAAERTLAIEAVGYIGTAEDLPMLDLIAAADPTYDAENKYYTFRFSASMAADTIRKSLAAEKKAR